MKRENPAQRSDRELAMGRDIPRRDFLNGAAMTIGAEFCRQGFVRTKRKAMIRKITPATIRRFRPACAAAIRDHLRLRIACAMELFGKMRPLPNSLLKNTT